MHAVSTSSMNARTTLSMLSDATLIEAEGTADRLRSWAGVMSAEHSGEPFIRFEESEWSIHFLAGDNVTADPEAGVEVETLPAGNYILVENVDFYGIDKALDALDRYVMESNTSRDLGPLEFHSVAGGGFAVGTLAIPVKGDLGSLPTQIESEGVPALGLAGHEGHEPQGELVEGGEPAPGLAPGTPPPLTAIAVTSQVGSLGETVAYLAAAELGWRYCRDSVVQEAAAGDPDVGVEDVERATRHRSRIERLLENLGNAPLSPMDPSLSMAPGSVYVPPMVQDDEARSAFETTMITMADTGNVVIAGHGAAQILRDHPTTLGVFICAPATHRMSRLANDSMPFEEAERFVNDADEERRAYFKDAYGIDWRDALEYDLVLNTGNMTPRMAATVIASMVRASRPD